MNVRGYEVGKMFGESTKQRLYLGSSESQPVVIKVAKTTADNQFLAEDAKWFSRLRTLNQEIVSMQAQQQRTSAHYELLFAQLVSSFMEPTQGNRQINVYAYPETSLECLVPLPKLQQTTRIDARTTVWILGRLFKLYGMYELMAASTSRLTPEYALFYPSDYLIDPLKHRLIVYNYSGQYRGGSAAGLIAQIAQYLLQWSAMEDGETELQYYALLKDFSQFGRQTFNLAHQELYQLVGNLWGYHYYPFTYRDTHSDMWQTYQGG